MKVAFVLGTISELALAEGEAISTADCKFLEKLADKYGMEAEIFLAVQDEGQAGKSGNKVSMQKVRGERDRLLSELCGSLFDIVITFGSLPVRALWNKGSGLRVSDLRMHPQQIDGIAAPI